MRFFIFLFLFVFAAQGVFAQQPSRQDLEKRRKALLREIAETQDQLATTQKNKQATIGQLRAINSKLRARQRLINTINSELGNINSDIAGLQSEIKKMNDNLDVLKMKYAESVRYAYKHRTSQSLILFLFSANSFNDAVRRMEYLKKYRDYRKKQTEQIRAAEAKLKVKIADLKGKKVKKAHLLNNEKTQKSQIQKEKAKTDQMVTELKGREGNLRASIRKNQRTANRIEAAIKAEIQREIAIARKKAEEEARRKAAAEAAREKAEEAARQKAAAASGHGNVFKAGNTTVTLNTGTSSGNTANNKPKKPKETSPENNSGSSNTITENPPAKPSYKLSLTPEVQALSNSFTANKGKLPWPVTNGYISSPYGRHPHPVYQHVMVDNHGIDIATYPHAPVRAVFSGTVVKITNISGYVVLISHGEYFTVYSHLSSVSVKQGEKVSTKQTIGTAGVNSDGENMINFQIWHVDSNNNSNTVNPVDWIAQ